MKPLYNYQNNYKIYGEVFLVNDVEYKIKSIGRVVFPSALRPSIQETLINLSVFIGGLYLFSLLSTIWIIIGIALVLLTGFNLWDIFRKIKKPTYLVFFVMKADQPSLQMKFSNHEDAEQFCSLIEDLRVIVNSKDSYDEDD